MKRFNTLTGMQNYFRKLNIPKDDIPYQFKYKGFVFTQFFYDMAGKNISYQVEKEIDAEGNKFIDIDTTDRYSSKGLKDAVVELY